MAELERFKVGDRVTWDSQALGVWRTKAGEVAEVLPPGGRPIHQVNGGLPRDHESYVVRAFADGRAHRRGAPVPKYYWPRLKSLRRADAPSHPPSGVIEIPLTQGRVALIDAEDARQARYQWYAHGHGGMTIYAVRESMGQMLMLHREILRAPEGMHVDHANGNGLDNRRCNLRLASDSQNQANRLRGPTNTSGYKGVCKVKGSNRWRAAIRANGQTRWLGQFDTPEAAGRSYDDAARELFGPFACVNFPREGERAA